MKFLVDMPLSPGLAGWPAERGHDAVHATNVGLHCAADSTILDVAQREGRVIVTADLDYPRLLALTKASGPGLVLFRAGNISESEARERCDRVLEVVPEEELPKSIIVIEKGRIRRRRLPIGPE